MVINNHENSVLEFKSLKFSSKRKVVIHYNDSSLQERWISVVKETLPQFNIETPILGSTKVVADDLIDSIDQLEEVDES